MAGAYALNALDAFDDARFEEHLAASEEARIKAAELSDTAVALGLATSPVQPSAALKVALMKKLASPPSSRGALPRGGQRRVPPTPVGTPGHQAPIDYSNVIRDGHVEPQEVWYNTFIGRLSIRDN